MAIIVHKPKLNLLEKAYIFEIARGISACEGVLHGPEVLLNLPAQRLEEPGHPLEEIEQTVVLEHRPSLAEVVLVVLEDRVQRVLGHGARHPPRSGSHVKDEDPATICERPALR